MFMSFQRVNQQPAWMGLRHHASSNHLEVEHSHWKMMPLEPEVLSGPETFQGPVVKLEVYHVQHIVWFPSIPNPRHFKPHTFSSIRNHAAVWANRETKCLNIRKYSKHLQLLFNQMLQATTNWIQNSYSKFVLHMGQYPDQHDSRQHCAYHKSLHECKKKETLEIDLFHQPGNDFSHDTKIQLWIYIIA